MNTIDICSLALIHIGKPPIDSLDGVSKTISTCKAYFPLCRDALLEEHPWGFATQEESLALSTYEPKSYSFAYFYPTKAIKIWRIIPAIDTGIPVPFKPYLSSDDTTKLILCNEENAVAEITRRITNTDAVFPALFSEALSFRLAEKLALGLGSDLSLAKEMAQRGQIAAAKAKVSSANEGKEDPSNYNEFIAARGQ